MLHEQSGSKSEGESEGCGDLPSSDLDLLLPSHPEAETTTNYTCRRGGAAATILHSRKTSRSKQNASELEWRRRSLGHESGHLLTYYEGRNSTSEPQTSARNHSQHMPNSPCRRRGTPSSRRRRPTVLALDPVTAGVLGWPKHRSQGLVGELRLHAVGLDTQDGGRQGPRSSVVKNGKQENPHYCYAYCQNISALMLMWAIHILLVRGDKP